MSGYVINLEAEAIEIQHRYEILLAGLPKLSEQDAVLCKKALDLAVEAHCKQRRKSGEPYIYHPLEVARIVVHDIGLGPSALICALLHDVVEDTDYTIQDLEAIFGASVAKVIDGLTKIDEISDQNVPVSMQAENFKKMLLTLSDDVRVILIKLADRLHNMRTLDSMASDKQLKIASETINVYAPLAHRLGLYEIKSELEDLSLKYTEPEVYEMISSEISKSEVERGAFVENFISPIEEKLKENGVKYTIMGRVKSITSIWGKMKKKGVPFEEVYDLFAIRIVIDAPTDIEKELCYKVYAIVTDIYRANPKRLRDWIAIPKSNGYEALHTTVMSNAGKWVEVQIRSKRMDEIAEQGYAAHWKYKNEGHLSSTKSGLDSWLEKIREMLENAENSGNSLSFLDDFKLNFFADEIYVYTPKGDVKTLPVGASILDFAFHIHSEIGFTVIGAKVNHKLVPINYVLNTGDQVEVIYSKSQKPTEEWLDYVVTSRARQRIRQRLKEEYQAASVSGRLQLSSIFNELNVIDHEQNVLKVKTQLNQKSLTDLYFNIAKGKITEHDIKRVFTRHDKQSWFSNLFRRKSGELPEVNLQDAIQIQLKENPEALVVGQDVKQINSFVSACCQPIHGDNVIGILTPNRGIEVHRINCPKAIELMSQYGNRIVKAKWKENEKVAFLTGVHIVGFDRKGMAKNILDCVSGDEKINIRSLSFTASENMFEGEIMLYINDTSHLNKLIEQLNLIEGVQKVERLKG